MTGPRALIVEDPSLTRKILGRGLRFLLLVMLCASAAGSEKLDAYVAIRDLVKIEGLRENPLVGYGMVVGLAGTGDRQESMFSSQTLGNILLKMAGPIPESSLRVKNVAAVFVTASLPAYALPGTQIDVTVSPIGDATTLAGGTLLPAALYGADGQIYGEAQGPLALGSYRDAHRRSSKQPNHPAAGLVPQGGLVERDTVGELRKRSRIVLLVCDPDISLTRAMAAAINREVGYALATAVDSRRVELQGFAAGGIPELLARLLGLKVEIQRDASDPTSSPAQPAETKIKAFLESADH